MVLSHIINKSMIIGFGATSASFFALITLNDYNNPDWRDISFFAFIGSMLAARYTLSNKPWFARY